MKPLPPTDRLYAHPRDTIPAFAFDEQVATVFDDMINRSVPGYRAVISLMGLFGEIFAQPNSTCYDLGCSLGASAIA
ncbi:MAG: tRNA (cmo5U34)-methyltransferase, partial [Halothiobacillaceae bacterium]